MNEAAAIGASGGPEGADVVVERHLGCSPGQAYAAVSDVTRMGEWSPETTSCQWLGGASRPAVGARFRGSNRRGFRRWVTTCAVTDAEAGSRFAFDVRLGPLPMARWAYDFTPEEDGCSVRESWTEMRPRWLRRIDRPVMAVRDRAEHNRENMAETLANLDRVLGTPESG